MKYKLEWTYKIKGRDGIFFTSDWMDAELAIIGGEDIEKSGKAKELIFYDDMGQSWNLKEMKKLMVEIEEDPHEVMIYFDGGFKPDSIRQDLVPLFILDKGKRNIG